MMDDSRADLLSPAFIGGLAGMAVDGTMRGFVIGAAVVWFALAALLTLAAIAVFRREQSIDALEAIIEKRARQGAATTS